MKMAPYNRDRSIDVKAKKAGSASINVASAVAQGSEDALLNAEWRAWHRVVWELARRGVDINEGGHLNTLHAALKVWSESLAALRRSQADGLKYSASEIERYEEVIS